MKKEFTPIAMRCNEEQFKAIEPKLKEIEVVSISSFENYPYLTNNFQRQQAVVSNIPEHSCLGRWVYKQWDEKVFLEACGIIEEENFLITREQILEIAEWGSLRDLEKIKQWFPKVFKTILEVGKWYKNNDDGYEKCFGLVVELNKNDKDCFSGYGFDRDGGWLLDLDVNGFGSNKWSAAADQEVKEALEREAKKRGLILGSCIDRKFDKNLGIEIINTAKFIKDPEWYYDFENDYLEHHGFVVYSRGKWAEIIPTITKEEAEKQLGKKIIN